MNLTAHPGDPLSLKFHLYLCRRCKPEHNSLYRELRRSSSDQGLIADSIRVGEFYVIRTYQLNPTSGKLNYTSISKDIIGVLENSPDMTEISFTKRVCEIDGILELPFDDIDLLKRKLSIYTLFS
jgi:hypothetical protein